MDLYEDEPRAHLLLKQAKNYYADNRYFEAGEDLRACLAVCHRHDELRDGKIANEAHFCLGMVLENMGVLA